MSYFGSAVLLDEAARTDITRTLSETGSTDVLCTQVADGCQFLQLELNRVWLRPVLEKVKTRLT